MHSNIASAAAKETYREAKMLTEISLTFKDIAGQIQSGAFFRYQQKAGISEYIRSCNCRYSVVL